MRILLFFIALLIGSAVQAQDYSIRRDSSGGFVMVQGAQATPFDTATVVRNITQKNEQANVLQNEIALLERLVLLRRQLAVVNEEKNTLLDILGKARQCGN